MRSLNLTVHLCRRPQQLDAVLDCLEEEGSSDDVAARLSHVLGLELQTDALRCVTDCCCLSRQLRKTKLLSH